MNIELANASVKYGKKYALKDFTFEFESGKIYCILGENGCGKTTMVRTLVSKYAPSGAISYVAQEMPSNVNLTVLDVVELGRYNSKKFFSGLSSNDKNLVENALSEMEIEDLKGRVVDTLSGGERQRVMIARSIAQDTEWTILDEPSSSLDVRHTEDVMKKIRNLVDNKGKSFIVVLHDINLASRYGDEFLLMKEGKLVRSVESLDETMLEEVFDSKFGKITGENSKAFFYPL